jgi:hypothetical protein
VAKSRLISDSKKYGKLYTCGQFILTTTVRFLDSEKKKFVVDRDMGGSFILGVKVPLTGTWSNFLTKGLSANGTPMTQSQY